MILSVIVADSDAHYLVSRQTRDGLAAVGMALDSLVSPELKCSYGTADMEGAATLAQDILKKNSETEVILYTATEYIDKGNFTVVNVADESDWNAAILYVKPTLEESNCYSFTVGAGCYGQSRSMTVYCELTGTTAESAHSRSARPSISPRRKASASFFSRPMISAAFR